LKNISNQQLSMLNYGQSLYDILAARATVSP